MQVAAASADRVADALAGLVQQTGDLLQARARGADQADPTAPHQVGKAEADAVQDGRAAIRAHHQQVLLLRPTLQLDLVGQRDVVGEQEHVQTLGQRLARFGRGELAGHRDDRQVGLRLEPMRAAHRTRLYAVRTGRPVRTRRGAPASSCSACCRAASADAASAARTAITRSFGPADSACADQQARVSQQLAIQVGGHDQRRVLARPPRSAAPRSTWSSVIESTYAFLRTVALVDATFGAS